jgi:hypothetical protein
VSVPPPSPRQRLTERVALAIYHAPGGKRFLNWFLDWCER